MNTETIVYITLCGFFLGVLAWTPICARWCKNDRMKKGVLLPGP